jgi:hypothetical protein
MPEKPKLRIVVLCCGHDFEAWQASALRQVKELGFIDFVLLVKEDYPLIKRTLWQKIKRNLNRNLIFNLYYRFVFSPSSMKLINLENELKEVPVLSCITEKKGIGEYFSPEDIASIQSYSPDIIIRFGFGILKGAILNIAKYGVWSYHHGDEEKYRGIPPGFWEIMNNDSVNGVILQKLTEKLDSGIILKKGFFKTTFKSYTFHLDHIYHESSGWLSQMCKAVYHEPSWIESLKPSETKAPIMRAPDNLIMIKFFLKQFYHTLLFHYTDLFCAEKWNSGIANKNVQEILNTEEEIKVNWHNEEKSGKFKADPFVYSTQKGNFMVYEDYCYKEKKAIIRTAYTDGNKSKTAITGDYHLSYPYIIEHEGEIFCIPESAQANKVMLYKLNKEKDDWENVKNLLEGCKAVDSTVFEYNGKWWLFCTMDDQNPNVNLFAFFSDSFFGPYQPHYNNPIKTDIHSARPAGNVFTLNNSLYRPSQDCSRTYGGSIVINKINKLNPFSFEEEVVKKIEPDKMGRYKHGIHNISFSNGLTLVDGKRYEFNFENLKFQVLRKIRKI